MLIAIEDYYLYAFGLICFFMMLYAGLTYSDIKKNCPDAMVHRKAAKSGLPVCRVHFRGRTTVDYIATIDKTEKEMSTPYWRVPELGIKFQPEADAIHFIENSIPCCDYYEKMPKSIKVEMVIAFSQVKDYFKKVLKIPIEGIEDLAFYIASESEISGVETALKDARISSPETKRILRNYINTINKHKEKLNALQLESGVFSWQTCMNAVDSIMGYTSSTMTHTIETVKAAERRKNEDKKKDFMLYAMVCFVLALAVGALYALTRK